VNLWLETQNLEKFSVIRLYLYITSTTLQKAVWCRPQYNSAAERK